MPCDLRAPRDSGPFQAWRPIALGLALGAVAITPAAGYDLASAQAAAAKVTPAPCFPAVGFPVPASSRNARLAKLSGIRSRPYRAPAADPFREHLSLQFDRNADFFGRHPPVLKYRGGAADWHVAFRFCLPGRGQQDCYAVGMFRDPGGSLRYGTVALGGPGTFADPDRCGTRVLTGVSDDKIVGKKTVLRGAHVIGEIGPGGKEWGFGERWSMYPKGGESAHIGFLAARKASGWGAWAWFIDAPTTPHPATGAARPPMRVKQVFVGTYAGGMMTEGYSAVDVSPRGTSQIDLTQFPGPVFYRGSFRRALPHGRGVALYGDGVRREGEFADGKFIQGRVTRPGGPAGGEWVWPGRPETKAVAAKPAAAKPRPKPVTARDFAPAAQISECYYRGLKRGDVIWTPKYSGPQAVIANWARPRKHDNYPGYPVWTESGPLYESEPCAYLNSPSLRADAAARMPALRRTPAYLAHARDRGDFDSLRQANTTDADRRRMAALNAQRAAEDARRRAAESHAATLRAKWSTNPFSTPTGMGSKGPNYEERRSADVNRRANQAAKDREAARRRQQDANYDRTRYGR